MNRISKPRIVDFLRLCDRHKWVHPRIRFASVRSKPELIADIHDHFEISCTDHIVCITPKYRNRHAPVICYDLEERKYMVDGVYREFQKESRERPQFQIRHCPTTIRFGSFLVSKNVSATQTASVVSSPFLGPGTHGPPAAPS